MVTPEAYYKFAYDDLRRKHDKLKEKYSALQAKYDKLLADNAAFLAAQGEVRPELLEFVVPYKIDRDGFRQ